MVSGRKSLKDAKRIVVKVGTTTITTIDGSFEKKRINELAMVLSDLHDNGNTVTLVTSGAIAAGAKKMKMDKKPDHIPTKQALAGIGQGKLIQMYESFFDIYDKVISQVLLTKDVFDDRSRRKHAKNTFNKLFEMGVIPIANENDTIAIEEIKFGDNDMLSALIADLTDADLLIILSDIYGLCDKDPKKHKDAKIIGTVEQKDIEEIKKLAGDTKSNFSTGGMKSKIEAAAICMSRGIPMVIANGDEPKIIFDILAGKEIGTIFIPSHKKQKFETLRPLDTLKL